MSHRYFLDSIIQDGHTILQGDQAHHAIQVMRSKVGDQIVLFDGKGTEHTASILEMTKKRLQLKIISSRAIDRVIQRKVAIAAALPKGDRQKFLIEKMVELGVDRFCPMKTARSVALANENVIQRMNRHVIEASKQCGRNYLMTIDPERSVEQLINSTAHDVSRFVASPTGKADVAAADVDRLNAAIVAVGPEGGFTADESNKFEAAGWKQVKLGPTILRIETAAIAAAINLTINATALR